MKEGNVHNNGGVTLFILICCIVLGALVVQVYTVGQENDQLKKQITQLTEENEGLTEENQQLKTELSTKTSFEDQAWLGNQLRNQVVTKLVEIGVWVTFDEDTQSFFMSIGDPMNFMIVPVTGGDEEKTEEPSRNNMSDALLVWLVVLLIVGGFLGFGLLYGRHLILSERQPVTMRVTRKEAETINYMRRYK